MPLCTSENILLKARDNGFAVGAFNADNLEIAKAIILAAEELRAPVIVQITPYMAEYGGLEDYAAIVRAEAKKARVPVCLHLDHGNSFEIALAAANAGYTSLMIDGSHLEFEKNVEITKKVVQMANKFALPVEAELGRIGGNEDGLSAAADSNTDPEQAKRFLELTGAFSLAVAIGTAHGFYATVPTLDKKRVSEIRAVTDAPLVLHGASGLSENDVKECVSRGICKVNFATELRTAYTSALKKAFAQNPDVFDPKVIGAAGIAAVKDVVRTRILVCGCNSKA